MKWIAGFILVLLSAVTVEAQTTRTVCASGCNHTTISAAITAAALGDTITVRAGETFTETLTLPVKAGSTYLTIRSDTADANLPPAGVRITPSYLAFMPTVRSPGSGAPTVTAAEGAHHYRFIGIYFPSTPGGFNDVIRLGSNTCDVSGYQEFDAEQPTDMELDRVWIKADAVTGQKVGVTLGGKRMNVINSRIEGVAALGQDSQAIVGANGSGPYRIENNHLEGAAENIMFGGADPCQRTVMTVTGTPTTTSASVTVSAHSNSGNTHNLSELAVGQMVAILTNGGTQRRHTIIRSITGSGTTGSITFDPISDVPDVPGDIRGGVQPANITVRRNYLTKPLRWRNPVIDSVNSAVATPETASGTLAAGTYQYSVVAMNTGCYANNNCFATAQTVTATLNATGRVKIDWQPSPTASHYRIYGRTSAVSQYWTVAVGTNTFTDTGSAGTSATSIPSSSKWQIKNLFELKVGANVQVDFNVFEYHWKGSDVGSAVWLKSANQSNGHEWAQVRDLVMENNLFQHIDGWLSMNGVEYYTGNQADRPANMTNITIRNNLVIDSTADWADGSAGVYAITMNSYAGGKIVNATIEHNTIAHYMRGLIQFNNTTKHDNLIFRNNMARRSSFGIFSSAGEGRLALEANVASYTVANNTIAGAVASSYTSGTSGTITGNFFPTATEWEATFENFTVTGEPDNEGPANYALSATSPYNDAGTDGLDLGPNIPTLLTQTESARTGGASPTAVAPTITTTSPLPAGTVGTAYSTTLQALGTGALTWAVQSGTLPTSLTLSSAGVLSGTPTVAQTQVFTVRVTDATTALTADQVLSLTIHPSYTAPTITTTTLTAATLSVPYTATLATTGGLAPFTWSVSSGTLPAGLTLNATTGVLAGTPSAAGAPSFTVQVTDALNGTDTQALSLTVAGNTLPCGRSQRFQQQEALIFRRPAPPTVSGTDCAALNDIWINTSVNPAEVNLITSTAGGVVTTTPIAGGSATTHALFSATHTDTVPGTPTEGTIAVGTENGRWTMLAPGPAGSFIGSDGASVGYFHPAGSTLRGTTVTLHTRPTGSTQWADMPSAATEFLGTASNRLPIYITGYTKARFYFRNHTVGNTGAVLWLEYSRDTVTWEPLDGSGGTGTRLAIDGAAGTEHISPEVTIAPGATGLIYFRIMGSGGNGVIDPTFGNIAVVLQ